MDGNVDERNSSFGIELHSPPNEEMLMKIMDDKKSLDTRVLRDALRRLILENKALRKSTSGAKKQQIRFDGSKRAMSAPVGGSRGVYDSNGRRIIRIRSSIKEQLPDVAKPGKPTNSTFYFDKSLNIDDLPQNTREFQIYAKLSKLSDLQLQQEITNRGLLAFQFRTPHEAKMAIVKTMDDFERSKKPISDIDLGKRNKKESRFFQSPYTSSHVLGTQRQDDRYSWKHNSKGSLNFSDESSYERGLNKSLENDSWITNGVRDEDEDNSSEDSQQIRHKFKPRIFTVDRGNNVGEFAH